MVEYNKRMNDMNQPINQFQPQNMPLHSPGSGKFGGFNQQFPQSQNPYLNQQSQSPVQNQAFQFYNKPQRSNTGGNMMNRNVADISGNSQVSKSQFDTYNIAMHQAKAVGNVSRSGFMVNQGFGNFGGQAQNNGVFAGNQGKLDLFNYFRFWELSG